MHVGYTPGAGNLGSSIHVYVYDYHVFFFEPPNHLIEHIDYLDVRIIIEYDIIKNNTMFFLISAIE